MSMAALLMATRDTLISELSNFYDNVNSTIQFNQRSANCRVMPDHCPSPVCGEEFISIYGSAHRPRHPWQAVAIEEQFGIVVAVTRRIALVPRDNRGEGGYIFDPEKYAFTWKTVEARCREIVGLIDKNYDLLRAAEVLFVADAQEGYEQPLVWAGTDPNPTQVDAAHFCAYHAGVDSGAKLPGIPEADDVYGLLMHVRFDEATRFQPSAKYDTT